jgi:hypothetical protein
MNNHITVIDVTVGVPGKYAVRVGPEVYPNLRLANCYHEATGTLVKTAGFSYANNQQYTSYHNLDEAINTAKNLKKTYTNCKVRVDCTVG